MDFEEIDFELNEAQPSGNISKEQEAAKDAKNKGKNEKPA